MDKDKIIKALEGTKPGSAQVMHTVEEVPQFAEYLTPAALDIYKSPMHTTVHSFPCKEGGWAQVQCQYLGITCDDAEPSQTDIQKLADWFNQGVMRGLLGWGCLAPAMKLPLANGRCLMLLYTYSDLPRETLNEKLGINNFVEEGAIPPE